MQMMSMVLNWYMYVIFLYRSYNVIYVFPLNKCKNNKIHLHIEVNKFTKYHEDTT